MQRLSSSQVSEFVVFLLIIMNFHKSSIDKLVVSVPLKSNTIEKRSNVIVVDNDDDDSIKKDEDEDPTLAIELRDLVFDKSDSVYPQSKKRKNNADTALPSLVAENDYIFGKLNEIEYSANVIFRDAPQFPRIDGERILENVREYFSTDMSLYMDFEKISNAYFDGSIQKNFNVIFRIDYGKKKQLESDITKITKSSVKVKVFKEVFVCRGVKTSLTGSVEVPFKDWLLERKSSTNIQINGNKRYRIVYWNVRFTYEDREYSFKVAFRFHEFMSSGSEVLCNIECESKISPELFMIIYHLLYSYYKQQYDKFNGFIYPIHPYFRIVETKGLSDFQVQLAETYVHYDYTDEDIDTLKTTSDYMHQFIRFLGVKSFMEYIPVVTTSTLQTDSNGDEDDRRSDSNEDVIVRCSDSFDEIEFSMD